MRKRKYICDILDALYACNEAIEWSRSYKGDRQKAWKECPRGDWMLWLIGRLNDSKPWSDGRKPLLACALDCALTVEHLWPAAQKKRIESAIKVLQKWIKGEATVAQAEQARRNLSDYAYVASAAVYASDAAYAAHAAVYASDAAVYASDAAYVAFYAAEAACIAACAADAGIQSLVKTADIVRAHFPKPPLIRRKEKA